MKSIPSTLSSPLPKGNLALGVPVLCCACRQCSYSLSAHLGPEMEELAMRDMKALYLALPDGVRQSMEVFGRPHAQAGHDVSLGLAYLVPMVGAEAINPAATPEEPA